MGIGAVELFHQLKPRRLIRVIVFESEGFEASKVCDHNQSILHNVVSLLNPTGRPFGETRPMLKASTDRLVARAEMHANSLGGSLTLPRTADTFRLL
jgi:hypothetical protein